MPQQLDEVIDRKDCWLAVFLRYKNVTVNNKISNLVDNILQYLSTEKLVNL